MQTNLIEKEKEHDKAEIVVAPPLKEDASMGKIILFVNLSALTYTAL